MVKPERKLGTADISDLRKDALIQWQHQYYFLLVVIFGYALPSLIAGYFWNDYSGGFYYASLLRMTIVHHGVFAVNSLAHHFGDQVYDDELTPRDHFLVALLTMGEGYHNFHHAFPMDYRNAILWYQYDPTKWFIAVCKQIGLASHLRVFPENEIQKGSLNMELKRLKKIQDRLRWPIDPETLPILSWEAFQEQSSSSAIVLVAGFIYDVSSFLDDHPGGPAILRGYVGKDATAAFSGGIYKHSNSAHNLLAMLRVAALSGGIERIKMYSPAEKMHIVERTS
ncbi:hypothetical protein PHLCEN_2v8519 [Hermanssonia centrifuga]|uniref:Cytochrome b5 heme-binding domain-containing protein n=1 Tax=Hermanssonia centrifuga TaxID=98765 RepID=A0A2R6NTE5_9APHY|nr:hypothetical protein PHLCEN_2v8519 [Hermanssonia centrifuga]